MKLDESYTHIDVCPVNEEPISDREQYYSDGVCPRCGHAAKGGITHKKQIVGRYDRPSFWERICRKQTEFIVGTETEIMNALKGDI